VKNSLLGMLSLLFCIVFSSSPANAARGGTVDIEGTPLYQAVKAENKGSIELIKLHKGTRLVASNSPTLGFHHVRLWSSLVGWVSAKALVLQPLLSPLSLPSNDNVKPALPVPKGGEGVPPTGDMSDLPPPSEPVPDLPAITP
jgi:hypothetical protein